MSVDIPSRLFKCHDCHKQFYTDYEGRVYTPKNILDWRCEKCVDKKVLSIVDYAIKTSWKGSYSDRDELIKTTKEDFYDC